MSARARSSKRWALSWSSGTIDSPFSRSIPVLQRDSGAILGDKTRMPGLAQSPNAFIRPSPSGGSLGGLTASTADARRIVEAGGFDHVFIETVGVGQSEVAVASVCDIFVLLVAPGGGDELQGIKRGVMELADVIVVNKCDGDREVACRQTVLEYRSAINMGRRSSRAPMTSVLACSSFDSESVVAVWDHIQSRHEAMATSGFLDRRRSQQQLELLDTRVRLLADELARGNHPKRVEIQQDVLDGKRSTAGAAADLFAALIRAETAEL